MKGDLLLHITRITNDCAILRTQKCPKRSQTFKSLLLLAAVSHPAKLRRPLSSTHSALATYHLRVWQSKSEQPINQRIVHTHLARSMNTTDITTPFSECAFRLGLGRGYPIRAIDFNIRCSLPGPNESVTVQETMWLN